MTFHDLHRPGDPLLLPNAWDYGSAAILAAHGFPSVGTTSLGVAAVYGKPDAAGATKAETLALARALCTLGVHVSVDIEGGFSDSPASVGSLVQELAAMGVAGVNLEDGRPDGTLRDVGLQREILAAALGHGVFVNARTDTHWLGTGDTFSRIEAYADADGIFVPGVSDLEEIAKIVSSTALPVNVLYQPSGPSLAALASVGVARVSTGSLLYRASVHAALSAALAVQGKPAPAVPSYADIVRLLPEA